MRIYLILLASCLSLVACKPKSTSDQTETPAKGQVEVENKHTPESPKPVDPSTTQLKGEVTTDHPADVRGNELAEFFAPFGGEFYSTCHSEKGITEDYFNGKEIPKLLVDKYELYDFGISPSVANQFAPENEEVVVKGAFEVKMGGKRLWIYTVGIALDMDEAEVAGVSIQALVVNDAGEIQSNYFVGGMVREPGEDISVVCRKLTYEKEMLKLTLMKDFSQNLPTHLRLKNETYRSLD